ncbi:ribonuclease H-like domain-containing protein [Tanacetum coccineum]
MGGINNGEYEMWEIRIKQYFQIQDYALWEVIENGNSWNDVKARSLLLMALPNEHQLTFDQYVDAQSMFAAIKARFGGNEATRKTQKALLKQQSLPSEWDTHVVVWMNKPDFDTMGLDDLYNNFKIIEQKVKRSAGANNDDKNLAFLTTSGTSSTNIINTANPEVSTGNTKVNTASTETSTASFSDATVYAFLSTQPQGSQLVHEDLEQIHDDDLEEMDLKWNMALLSMRARKFYQRTRRKIIIDGSSTAGYDKSKVECFNYHKMGHFARECRAPRSKDNRNWNQGSSSKAVRIEDASEKAMCAIDGAGFDWSDMAEEEIQANMALMAFSDSEVTNDKSCSKSCLKNYEALKKQYDDLLVKLDDTSFKASTYKKGLSILEGQILNYKESEVLFFEEIALLKRSVGHKEYQSLRKKRLRKKRRGLNELEKVKEEKEGFEFKIAKFEKSSKDLDQLLANQITNKSKKGFGYNAVPSPHPLILNRPTPLDLSYSGLEEFKQPEVNEYGPRDSSVKPTTGYDKELDNSKENTDDSLKQQQKIDSSSVKVDKDWKENFFCPANHVREEEPKKARENNDAPIIEDWVSDDEDDVEPIPKVEKKTVIPTATKKEFVKLEKLVMRSVRYAEIYRSQRPRGNQRNWNGQQSNQLGCNFVFNNKACFICGSFDHIQYSCPNVHKHMAPRAVLMKTGLKSINTTRPVNTVRSSNTGRPFSTARSFNTVRPSYTAHPKSTVHWQGDLMLLSPQHVGFGDPSNLMVHHWFSTNITTTEAEYVAAASCCGHVLWIQNQLLDYGYNFMNTVIYINNNITICIIENPVQHSKTKHIEIRHHFIRDCNAKKLIQMAKIDSEHNVADLLTKGFDAGRFQYLVSRAGSLSDAEFKEKEVLNYELFSRSDSTEVIHDQGSQVLHKKIDWNDPSVIRYHALKMKPKIVAQARKNMIKYLKNQGNYKISDFKGMSYDEIRPIFEKVWDFNQQFEPMDMEHGSEKMKSLEKIEEKDDDTQEEVKEVVKEPGEELKEFLDSVPREEFAEDVESLSTKYPIVDWNTYTLIENFMYYQIFRGDGSSKNYKVLSEMFEDFDRQDVEELYKLVKERYSQTRLAGYDLMLWGDLHTLFEPGEEDEILEDIQHE